MHVQYVRISLSTEYGGGGCVFIMFFDFCLRIHVYVAPLFICSTVVDCKAEKKLSSCKNLNLAGKFLVKIDAAVLKSAFIVCPTVLEQQPSYPQCHVLKISSISCLHVATAAAVGCVHTSVTVCMCVSVCRFKSRQMSYEANIPTLGPLPNPEQSPSHTRTHMHVRAHGLPLSSSCLLLVF